MKPLQQEETTQQDSARGSWWSIVGWSILTLLVFIILARLGFKAAQARRVTWVMAVLGACLAAAQALVGEVHLPRRLPIVLALLFGAGGGVLVSLLLSAAHLLPAGWMELYVSAGLGALLGGGECWLLRYRNRSLDKSSNM